jgi:signal transduction histidine kinase
MSAEVLAQIKQPYFSQRPGGTGLGVVIADGIVRQHGGRLDFQSTLGVGTRAVVTLPRINGASNLP